MTEADVIAATALPAPGRAEQGVSGANLQLQDVLDAMPHLAALLSAEGTVLRVNRLAFDISEVTPEEVLGKPFAETYWWSHDPEVRRRLRAALTRAAAGEASRYDVRVRVSETRFLVVDFKLAPLLDAAGRVSHLLASGLDISGRLRDEAVLSHQQWRLQLALEAGAMGTFEWDLTTDEIVFDDTDRELFGLGRTTGTLTGEIAFKQVYAEDLPGLKAVIDKTRETNSIYDHEFRVHSADGSLRWLAGRGNFVRDADGRARYLLGINYDVTERKLSEERLHYLAQASKLLISSLDVEATLQQTAEIMVPFLADWCVIDVPDDSGALRQVAVAHADPSKLELAGTMRRLYPPDPRSSQGAVKVVATGERALFPDISDDMLAASAQDAEHLRLIRAVGMSSALIVPLKGRGDTLGALTLVWAESGRRYTAADLAFAEELAGRAALAVDNATLYRASRDAEEKLKALNAELETRVEDRTAKLGALNQELEAFNYSVSHDLRAPLRGVTGFSEALLEDYGSQLDETGQHYVARIQAAATRMGQLIDDLLDLSRLARADMKVAPLDLSELAQTVADDLGQRYKNRVVFDLEPGLSAVGDVRLLKVVLENLLGNAWKFTQRIEQAAVAFGRTSAGAFFVRDNGAGFDMRYAAKLFSPFQRLHSPQEFEGSGIGLATVQRVIHRHGGTLWAESEVDAGATFYFTLPALNAEASTSADE
ncbi:hypothetical protein BH24DEI2_BH24DEI2_06090 [soil metagenome]